MTTFVVQIKRSTVYTLTGDKRLTDSEEIVKDNEKYIDCFTYKKVDSLCLINDTNFYLAEYFTKGKYILIIQNKTQMKLVEEQSLDRGIELFDGKLKGVSITAAVDLEHSGKQFVVFFAGRHLCKQEISRTNWTKLCDIEDIADWIDCTDGLDNDIKLLHIILVALVIVVVVLIIALIVGLCCMCSNRNSKSDTSKGKSLKDAIKSDLKAKDIIEPDPI